MECFDGQDDDWSPTDGIMIQIQELVFDGWGMMRSFETQEIEKFNDLRGQAMQTWPHFSVKSLHENALQI